MLPTCNLKMYTFWMYLFFRMGIAQNEEVGDGGGGWIHELLQKISRIIYDAGNASKT